MIYVGIDPGLKGYLAFLTKYLDGSATLQTYPMPLNETGVDGHKIVMLLHNWKPDRLILEDQFAHKFDRMGKAGILTMGQNWGKIVGAAQALQIKVNVVLPVTWQAKIAPKKIFPDADPKRRSLLAAKRYFPNFNFKTDGETDATLLAQYGSIYHP